MDKQVASALIDIAVRELRLRSYADFAAMIGDPQCKEVRGSDGKRYQIEIETFWDVPRKQDGNLRVILSVDDGTFTSAFHPMTRTAPLSASKRPSFTAQLSEPFA